MLEGRGTSGRHGAIWEVIPTIEWLINLIEEKKDRVKDATPNNYPDQEAIEDHYEINVNAGWLKLKKYWEKLDDTPVYYAAAVLHPYYHDFCKKWWSDRPDWLRNYDAAFQKLWLEYKNLTLTPTDVVDDRATKRRKVEARTSRDDFIRSIVYTAPALNLKDEFARWNDTFTSFPETYPLAFDPITYWWQQRDTYPRLSKMALDVLTIPTTSDDCERSFSIAGDLLEPRRNRLQPDIIAALMCCRSYKRMGFEALKRDSAGKRSSQP